MTRDESPRGRDDVNVDQGCKNGMNKMGKLYLATEDGREFELDTCADSDLLYRSLREAVGASPDSALKLRRSSKSKDSDAGAEGESHAKNKSKALHISPRLPPNSPQERYVVTVYPPNGMLVDEVDMDLASLENRVGELEKQLADKCHTLPPAVHDLKKDVEKFRRKLETTRHLSWLHGYKDLPPSNQRLQYRRRSDAKHKIVREQFLQICEDAISEEVIQCLRLSSFDSMQWSDEELLSLLYFMFSDLGLIKKFSLDLGKLKNFLFQVFKNYNEVPFHNFRHGFCVTQMMYAMMWKAELFKKLADVEILILLVSCLCHDLDHPGYNNIYQINARTELALRYNDISPLENHHCSIAFRILEMDESNIFKHMNIEDFKYIREGIIRCILATDMARHNEILAQFKDAVFVGFDYSNKSHVNLLCMVLIKVADISNEVRPMEVAEPWLDRLLQEFFTQSDAEKVEGLPVTPFMDKDKITKPSSQCSFIGFVVLPLFEALGDLLDDLVPMVVEPARAALEHYRRLNEAHHKNSVADSLAAAGSVGNGSPCSGAASSPTKNVNKSMSGYSLRKTSISFSPHPDEDDEDVITDLSTDDEETVTEVAVSEKTLKFKISTESSSDRRSHPGSRKGSRDRHQDDEEGLLLCDSCQRRDPTVRFVPQSPSTPSDTLCDVPKNGVIQARSHSLAEPEWRYGASAPDPSHKRRSSSTVSTCGERRKSGGVFEGGKAKKKEENRSPSTVTVSSCPSPKKSSSLSPSLVTRLKRLGWKSAGDERNLPPGSPASLKDQITTEENRLTERRVSTLPKVNRKRFASEARKGWRGLLGRRDEASTSKRNGLSTDSIGESEESLPVNNNKSKKKSVGGGGTSPVDRSPQAQRHPPRWAMSSLVSSFRSKKSKSLHEPPR